MKYETEICICCSILAFYMFKTVLEKYEEFKPQSILVNKDISMVVIRLKFNEWNEKSSAVKEFNKVVEILCEGDFNTNPMYAFNYIKLCGNSIDDEQSFNSSGKKFSPELYIDRFIHIPNDEYIKIIG